MWFPNFVAFVISTEAELLRRIRVFGHQADQLQARAYSQILHHCTESPSNIAVTISLQSTHMAFLVFLLYLTV